MPRKSDTTVVTNLVKKVWPNVSFEKGGKELYVECPFCSSSSAKCAINPTKGLFHCWVCGEKGPTLKILNHLRRLGSITQADVESVKKGKIGLTDKIKSLVKPEEEVKVLWSKYRPCVFPPKVFPLSSWEPKGTLEGNIKKKALRYLKTRKIPDEFIDKFRIHACCNRESVYHGHLFFPVMGEFGRQMKYWTTRTLGKKSPKSLHAGSKYSAYKVKTILVNEHLLAPRKEDTVILCEGPFDALSLYNVLGIPACPLFGKHLHSFARNQLKYHSIKNVVVCLDWDAKKDAKKLASRLSGSGFNVSVMELEGGDPNSIPTNELKEYYKNATSSLSSDYDLGEVVLL